jgi:hypothetical protein
MARPESIADLDQSTLSNQVVTIQTENAPLQSTFYNALGAFLASCEKLGMVTTKSYSTITISQPYSHAEKLSALSSAQDNWDRNYRDATSETAPESHWRRSTVESFAHDEGLPTPEWA